MSHYELQERLPACEVDKDLLTALEGYFLRELPSRFKSSEEQGTYSISITDNLGTEKFSSIQDFTPKLLPDATKSVEIRWSTGFRADPAVLVKVRFDPAFYISGLSIDVTGQNAREIALGIRDRYHALVEPHKTLNWVFNPFAFPFLSGTAGILSWIPATIAVSAAASSAEREAVVFGMITLAFLWYWASGSFLRRYVMFDTRLQARKSAFWKWISLGFLTFVPFGSVLFYARRRFLGF